MTAIKNGTLLVKDSNGNTARVATLSQTDITTLNTALTDIEVNKRKISSISANYVTTNTAQTISAQKTFSYQSEPIHIKETRFDVSLKPSENVNNSVVTFDKNNKEVGYYQVSQESNGNNSTSIAALHYKTDGTLVRGSIRVGVNNKGDTYTYAPNPADDSNNTEIATTKFVNDKISSIGSNYVTTNTAQTITGQKTFTAGSTVLKNTNFDALTTDKGEFVNRIVSRDKNGLDCNYINFWQNNDKVGNYKRLSTTSIGVNLNKDDGTKVSGNIHIDGVLDKSGAVNFYAYAPTPDYRSTNDQIATCKWVRSYIMPAGVIIPFAGSSIPTGYLLCNGAVVSRTTYADLFKVIGTTYGAGDGSTTFNLPDLRDRFLEGAGTNAIGRYLSAGLPNITGGVTPIASSLLGIDQGGALSWGNHTARYSETQPNEQVIYSELEFHANNSNSIYSASQTVQPSAIAVQYLIKY